MKTMKTKQLGVLLICALIIYACKPSESTPKEIKQYTIEQFYKNKQVGGGAFSDDESKMLVSSNESGIYNVYEIDLASGEQKAVTDSKDESFFAQDYVPGTNDILYSADKGGNEISHIYLQKEDGTVQDLTPGEKEKASFYGWNEDKTEMYYGSNKRDPKYFDVYKMKIGDWKGEMLYKNDDGINFNDISYDEKIIALTESVTTSSNKLYLYNRDTKKRTEISDAKEPGEYGASGFSRDNKSFFYTTNAGKEFTYLVKYDVASGKRETIFETDWDVWYSYLSEKETYRVTGINEDGRTSLRITNNKTGKPVKFPEVEGNITSISISDSEKLARLSVGSSKAPRNLYLYNFETNEVKQLTNTLNPEINPDHLVNAEVVRYKSFDGLEIPAIYYKPLTASKDNKVPALVWVHGGPGGQSRVGYFSLIQYMVNHGYAVLAVNNRGSSGYGKTFYKMDDLNHGDKDLKDCVYGKKYLETLDYINKDQIGIIGGSYGGYMTMAALTFEPEEFEVGVNIFGVTNWLRTLKSIPPYWESFRESLYKEIGDPNTADSVRLYDISPLFHADKVTKPLMVLQGANDPRVLQVESDEIVAAVEKNNVPVKYMVFEDEGHGFVKKENEIEGYGAIVEFLDKYLRKTEPADK